MVWPFVIGADFSLESPANEFATPEDRCDMPYSTVVRTSLVPFLVFTLLALSWTAAQADPIPSLSPLPVRGYILLDHQSGNVLAEMKSDERMEPASITKLMTAYVAYKALKSGKIKSDDKVTISKNVWQISRASQGESSKMFLDLGSQVSVEDLLMGMVVQSGNDAAVALAEHVAGSASWFISLTKVSSEPATCSIPTTTCPPTISPF